MTETLQAVAPPETVAALYHAHVRPLYAFIYSKVGNRAAAEDLTSDVFLKALTHLDPTRPEHSSVAWLYRVARNAVHDYWRQSHVTFPIEEARTLSSAPPSPPVRPWDSAAAAARASAILERLPENYRTVLSLRLLDGLSVAETAERMGLSANYVKVMQHRALKAAARHDRI
jgi:RNA polymerase sigma-70 factor (ECF subfamily)